MRSLRNQLTYANVVATLALFVALSTGGAWAAHQVLIGGKQIKNGSITGKDVKRRSLTGAQIKPESITGRQVAESKLGKVPSAAHADTADTAARAVSADALQGVGLSGLLRTSHVLVGSASTATVGTLLLRDPRTGLEVRTGNDGGVRIVNPAGNTATIDGHSAGFFDQIDLSHNEIKVAPGEQVDVTFLSGGFAYGQFLFQQRSSAPAAAVLLLTCTERSPELSCIGIG
ncbi:MAG TPA: hypothetical protein VE972_02320 [Conexibacter sp.]|nr:hypothetical protein [Conexibacter sp.]